MRRFGIFMLVVAVAVAGAYGVFLVQTSKAEQALLKEQLVSPSDGVVLAAEQMHSDSGDEAATIRAEFLQPSGGEPIEVSLQSENLGFVEWLTKPLTDFFVGDTSQSPMRAEQWSNHTVRLLGLGVAIFFATIIGLLEMERIHTRSRERRGLPVGLD